MGPFKEPRLKVERAEQHIVDLNKEITAFLDTKPYSIVINPCGNADMQAWTVRIREQIPNKIALILGDAFHNLRAALDLPPEN